ncbi:MAG: hypothetical protein WDN24_04925 [Sphingomonas sp.]
MEIALDAGGIVGTWDLDVQTNRLTRTNGSPGSSASARRTPGTASTTRL